jgi:hypothetical protein
LDKSNRREFGPTAATTNGQVNHVRARPHWPAQDIDPGGQTWQREPRHSVSHGDGGNETSREEAVAVRRRRREEDSAEIMIRQGKKGEGAAV